MSERLIHLGTDVDDCLIDSAELVATTINKQYGTNLSSKNWYQPHDPEAWGVDDQRVAWGRVNDVLHSREFIETVQVVEGAERVLRAVKLGGHSLSAATGRPDTSGNREMTFELLEFCYPGLFTPERLHFTDHFGQSGKKGSKVDVAKVQQFTHFVDDNLDHANPLAEAGYTTYLLGDYPWNQGEAHPNVMRVPDWDVIGEHFFNDVERYVSMSQYDQLNNPLSNR